MLPRRCLRAVLLAVAAANSVQEAIIMSTERVQMQGRAYITTASAAEALASTFKQPYEGRLESHVAFLALWK